MLFCLFPVFTFVNYGPAAGWLFQSMLTFTWNCAAFWLWKFSQSTFSWLHLFKDCTKCVFIIVIMTSSAKTQIYGNIISTMDQNRNQKSIPRHRREKKILLSQAQSLPSHLPWSARAEHTGALAFDHGNFNQSFSHFIGNSSPPSPFKHCLGELSAAGSISGNYTCKVMLGAGLNISAKCMCCWEALKGTAAS